MPTLAALRRRRLLSQRELANRAGVAPSSVYQIERGIATPRLVVMRKILQALGLDDATQVDEFRRALALEAPDPDVGDSALPDAATDPVLAQLWDNPEDDVYDHLAGPPHAPA